MKAVVDAARALSKHYGVEYDSVWLNFYRDGRDSTGWHRDRFSCRRPECVVPVLTLGATRRFQLKPRDGGAYESVPMFMEKGFRVLPASWKNTDAGLALILCDGFRVGAE